MSDMEMTLTHSDKWRGRHRSFGFSISRTEPFYPISSSMKYTWAFYILANAQSFPEDIRDQYIIAAKPGKSWQRYDYSSSAWEELEWHGGVTYYAKHDAEGEFPVAEVGCDFQHLWDMERCEDYQLDNIEFEARRCIDSMFDRIPGLLCWSSQDGSYVPESELTIKATL